MAISNDIRFDRTNRSYSGCDIEAFINIGDKHFLLGNLQTMSYSIHRDKVPVRTLGRTYAKAYTRGQRTIAGTLIFTVFDRHVLSEAREAYIYEQDNEADYQASLMTDQLPPFDVTITYTNEYGASSILRIYAVDISDEGQTHSIEDMITENVMQYTARDIDLMIGDATIQESTPVKASFDARSQNSANPGLGGRMSETKSFTYAMFNRDGRGLRLVERVNSLESDIFFFEERILRSDTTIKRNLNEISTGDATVGRVDILNDETNQLRNDIKDDQKSIQALKLQLTNAKSAAGAGPSVFSSRLTDPISRIGSNSIADNPFDPSFNPKYKDPLKL